MTRAAARLTLLGVLSAAAFGVLAPQAIAIGPTQTQAPSPQVTGGVGRPWFCIYNDQLDFGFCQYDPLPL